MDSEIACAFAQCVFLTTRVQALHSPSLVISEPQPGGQRRRLTEAVPQPAVSIISLSGQRLFHRAVEIWEKSAPERWHLCARMPLQSQPIPERHLWMLRSL